MRDKDEDDDDDVIDDGDEGEERNRTASRVRKVTATTRMEARR